jgi:uncharacterized protein (DUF2062 family)
MVNRILFIGLAVILLAIMSLMIYVVTRDFVRAFKDKRRNCGAGPQKKKGLEDIV